MVSAWDPWRTADAAAFVLDHDGHSIEAVTHDTSTEGLDHLLAAGQAVGAKRFVAQSYAGWPYARTGGPVKDESDPLDPDAYVVPKANRTPDVSA